MASLFHKPVHSHTHAYTHEHKLPSISHLLTLSPRPELNQRLSPEHHQIPSISSLTLPFRPVSPPCEDTLPPLQGDDPPQRLVRSLQSQAQDQSIQAGPVESPTITPAQSPVSQPPALKRRRGRPPNLREPIWEGGWVFLAPTVWEKRGRKPKHHIVGHSCFVWKELTSTRAIKPKKVCSSVPNNLRLIRKAPEQAVE
ncbi:hypothetical protein J3Q64DRAFT_1822980 [Phycomyces blakesleeanus]|uniref:Uncharacterized protein n=1 Tax=Phycomyces blakesleeanus TaxID=4837 RepID=A0ABR3AWG0_PHYBL